MPPRDTADGVQPVVKGTAHETGAVGFGVGSKPPCLIAALVDGPPIGLGVADAVRAALRLFRTGLGPVASLPSRNSCNRHACCFLSIFRYKKSPPMGGA